MKHKEIKTYYWKSIGVTVELDYDNRTISLVHNVDGEYIPKAYEFSGRSIEYMNGWVVIAEAIKSAVKEAKDEMQAHIDTVNEEDMKKVVDLAIFNRKDDKKIDYE